MMNTKTLSLIVLASLVGTASAKKHKTVVVEASQDEAGESADSEKSASVDVASNDDASSGDGAGTPSVTAVEPAHAKTFGMDGALVVPLGNYGNAATVAVGALARLEIPQGKGFITARAGVLFHALNDGYGTSADGSLVMIPLYGGYRYPLADNGVYIAGELGITYARASVQTPYGTMAGSDTELGLTITAGMRRGPLDLRAGFIAPSIGDSLGLMASAGYDFAAF